MEHLSAIIQETDNLKKPQFGQLKLTNCRIIKFRKMKKIVLILLLMAIFGRVLHAQESTCLEMDIEIIAINQFEESRLEIMSMLDSIQSRVFQMFEYKDGSKPRVFIIEFYTDDSGFRFFDEAMYRFGHIEKKRSGMKMIVFFGDSLAIKTQILQNNEAIQNLDAKFLSGESDTEQILSARLALKEENMHLYENLFRLQIEAKLPNRIKITLSS